MRAHEFITEHRLVFKKNANSGSISMKWRCESGPRKNKTVADASQCSAAPDIKKSAKMKNTRKRTKVAQARKTKKTKRVNPMTKTATRLNKLMKKGLREDTTSLNQIYQNDFPDRDEAFWDYVTNSELNNQYEIQTMQPYKLDILLKGQYRIEHIDELYDIMEPEQQEVVDDYMNSNLSNQIIVIADGRIIDGNHRALAAVKSKQPIKYIDLDDIEDQENINEDNLSEIGYADELGQLSIPNHEIIDQAEQFGTIDQKPVWRYTNGNKNLYFFKNNTDILAVVLLNGNNLKAIKNFTDRPGYIYAILNFLITVKNIPIKITADEELTPDGFKWVMKIIDRGNGLRITDKNEAPIDASALRDEWEKARQSGGTWAGETELYIKEQSSHWKNKLLEQQTSLMPYLYFNIRDRRVSDFKQNIFENLSQYRRWTQSPKDSKRGMTRHYVDRYETVVRPELVESTSSFNTRKKEATAFSKAFKAMDERDGVNIEVGKNISVLSTVVVPSDKTSHIEVSGFVKPKQITKINLDTDNKIDTIEFSDGSIFPEAAEFTTVGGVSITNTVFFPDYTSASKAYTALWMMLTSMEGKDWKVENYMSK